ncbi:MAG: bifunctional [glutamate--ammonia ligase]-adenylyl-L-tyrosine phosphorylase/[glutamate--ammonia-ligase] adenylyltransferase [Deltaproteobacteria bacterium]|nr:bifunctional [glutamate--ammonia ligase]-adenylyl-L-tyrosine phosphorylase/[glutamate--ammonia-ligase] adenylyltransferase [Deltaproteobacteria bacterium]
MNRTPASAPSLIDRLLSLGVENTARALPLVEEIRKRLSWGEPDLAPLWKGAEAAPDPLGFFLGLSKLADTAPTDDLAGVISRPEKLRALGALLGGSEFLSDQIARRREIFSFLFLEDGFMRRADAAELMEEAVSAARSCSTEKEIKAALRRMKLREVARIATRDLSGLSPLAEVTEDLSSLAAAALSGAIGFARRTLTDRYGAPLVEGADGRECGFVVMGMGKLGGVELNFSSDIDLLYLYETDHGMTGGGAEGKTVTLHQYFVRLSEMVTRIVSEVTEDGFVFRVDLRLRPEGTKGDLANSLRSAEIYYESWGQAWERAALIKARPVAGDLAVGEEFLRIVTPFVYRKYLDFTSIEEIKEMKDRIDLAAARSRKGGRDLKLGVGGIREIEFFAQAHQLIYGGKAQALRMRGTMQALEALARLGIVPKEELSVLSEAYGFLRTLEHRIQVFQERQTHTLPQREEDLSRLARSMGMEGGESLLQALESHTENVRASYGRLFRGAPEEASDEIPADVQSLFLSESGEEETAARMKALGFADPVAAARNLATLRDGPPFVRLPSRARRYLGKITPAILARAIRTHDRDMALAHAERFLAAIGARTMFYALLFENPKVVDALVRLFGSSPYLSGYLLRHPELLDTFLKQDLNVLGKSKSDLRREAGEALAACNDFEQEMDELRRFRNLETLRIGTHDLSGSLSLEEGMYQLSALAEVLLANTFFIARREVSRRFGIPVTDRGGEEAKFCVLGLGKLGSEELSYHSDLDIIFVYSGEGETVPPPGADPSGYRKLTNHEYFAKIAQRMISILTTVTREGYVYKLDTRLRPSGNAGPLVSSMTAFEKYHERSAQLWERQALLKCRFVAGDRDFGKKVEAKVAGFIYCKPLPADAAMEIHRLRTRMEVELGKERTDRLNLKVGKGGVVDVEFAVQYLQLQYGAGSTALRARSTLKALYELMRAGRIEVPDYQELDGGYRFLRALEVRLRLSQDASIEQFDPAALGPELLERYREETGRIRKVYLKILGLRD